ncbi:hypothetical protein J2X09_005426 [Hydrogenophaga laconesensis]|uniref:Methyl-accepting chemotaxis protein n=1 Tax=Hydrogenophaga laconesensis TaxID=1805971 RepID=A0ABU1VJY8_9BURK|nr:hypothetical protein [Hydrogenophaga laconesensis]
MTQQNAALVEESAAAAESLKDQARRLDDVVRVFRTGDGDTARPMTPATPEIKPTVIAPEVSTPVLTSVVTPAATPAQVVKSTKSVADHNTPVPAKAAVVPAPAVRPQAVKPAPVVNRVVDTPAATPIRPAATTASSASSEGDWESF